MTSSLFTSINRSPADKLFLNLFHVYATAGTKET